MKLRKFIYVSAAWREIAKKNLGISSIMLMAYMHPHYTHQCVV